MDESSAPVRLPTPRRVGAGVWLRTLGHLRAGQLRAQLWHRLRATFERPARFASRPAPATPACAWPAARTFLAPGPADHDPAALRSGRYHFLSRDQQLGFPPRWNTPEAGRLWEYNLHYFEWLYALDFADARDVVQDWIGQHPLARGAVGWEPYPTSLRLVNWCAVFMGIHAERTAGDPAFGNALWRSIHLQAEWLGRHLETHIQANHLLENAVALAFTGSCFAGAAAARWKRKGLALLDAELPEQIRSDGVHYEQSPMYQLRVGWALTALLATGDPDLARRVREPLQRMRTASLDLAHPDGEIALLNDAAFGVYGRPERLWSWWSELENDTVKPVVSIRDPLSFAFRSAGYYGARGPAGHYLVCDAGPFGPDHQPGHAHADLFSFELSLSGQRVIRDTGVYDYEVSARRRYARSTRAHNTVEIAGLDQCELWSAFRVGRRGRPRDVRFEPTPTGFTLEGWHDGYAHLPGRPRHHRAFEWDQRGVLLVRDTVTSGVAVPAVSRLHLHPDCRIESIEGGLVEVASPAGAFWVAFAGNGRLAAEESAYFPAFGVEIASPVLVFSTTGSDVRVGFAITNESPDDARSLSDALLPA